MIALAKEKLYALSQDSLFRNSFYLMLATAVMAGFGFFFWLINARLFSTAHVGLATTLISVMNLIATLSLIGFDMAFVRFLPASDQRNDKLNTGMILVGGAALLLSTTFVLFVGKISPQLAFIAHPAYGTAFVLFCAMSALNILTDAVFLAAKSTKYTLIINAVFSVIKMTLPFAFISWGAMGIFTAAAAAQSVGFVLSVAVMIWKLDYRPRLAVNIGVIKRVWRYCAGNYIAGALNLLPATVLPVLITNRLGAEQAAYYYMAMMIGNLLYTIPWATTKSLFAESSHNEQTIGTNIKKSIKTISFLLLPAIIALIFWGKYILTFFGKGYSTDGIHLLYLIAITGVMISIYSLFGIIFRVRKNLQALIIINLIYTGSIIGLAYLFLSLGLPGIGYAWLLGNGIAGITGWILFSISKKRS